MSLIRTRKLGQYNQVIQYQLLKSHGPRAASPRDPQWSRWELRSKASPDGGATGSLLLASLMGLGAFSHRRLLA